VKILTGSNRLENNDQKDFFEAFLLSVRNGTVTKDQWLHFSAFTSPQAHINRLGSQAAFDEAFYSPSSTHYYCTNAEILEHNISMLRKTQCPILRINAKNNPPEARYGDNEETRRLPTVLYLSRESKVLLTSNLDIAMGLVNGTTGITKDFIYGNDDAAPNVPVCIIVDFPTYSGPRFFADIPNQNRRRWVPIRPITVQWFKGPNNTVLERSAIPLSLAWGWTPWKGQGTTNREPCVMHLGVQEKAVSLAYVMLSRVTSMYNICIQGGVTYERLTTEITKHARLQCRINEETRLQGLSDQMNGLIF